MRSSDSDNMGLLLEAARVSAFGSKAQSIECALTEVLPRSSEPLPARETIGFAL